MSKAQSASSITALFDKIIADLPARKAPQPVALKNYNIQRFTMRLKDPVLEASRVIVRNKIRASRKEAF